MENYFTYKLESEGRPDKPLPQQSMTPNLIRCYRLHWLGGLVGWFGWVVWLSGLVGWFGWVVCMGGLVGWFG